MAGWAAEAAGLVASASNALMQAIAEETQARENAGYLTAETDPGFAASPAYGITTNLLAAWNAAHAWGDHAAAGYLTAETDPGFAASPAYGITTNLLAAWNAAYPKTGGTIEGDVDLDGHNLTDAGKIGIGNAGPDIPLQVGAIEPAGGDYQVVVGRSATDTQFGTNGHAFADMSYINRGPRIAYNSFDANILFHGTNSYDHYAGFQSRPTYNSSGAMGRIYAYVAMPNITAGTVSNRYGFYAKEVTPSGGSVLERNYGFYAEQMAGGRTNWGLYLATSNNAFIGGPTRIGSETAGVDANYPATVLGVDGDAFFSGIIRSGGGAFNPSVDAGYYFSRGVTQARTGVNARAFTDISYLYRGGEIDYYSFEAKPQVVFTNNYGRIGGLVFVPAIATAGTVEDAAGLWSAPTFSGGTVKTSAAVRVSNPAGTGTVEDVFGVYVSALDRGTSNNFAFYSAGSTPSRFGAIALGTNAPVSDWSLLPAGEPLWTGESASVARVASGIVQEKSVVVADGYAAHDVANDNYRALAIDEDGWLEHQSGYTNYLWHSVNGSDRTLPEWRGAVGEPEATRIAGLVGTAEAHPQAIALADGYATVWSTGKWQQSYSAIGASTVRVERPPASLTNAAGIVLHFRLWTNYTVFVTNNLLGFTTTGILTNGATNTAFIDWKPGDTNANWKLLH